MKFKIVFYLFIFVCIILFFQLINTNKLLNYQDDLIQSQNRLNLTLKDSIKDLNEYRRYRSCLSVPFQVPDQSAQAASSISLKK